LSKEMLNNLEEEIEALESAIANPDGESASNPNEPEPEPEVVAEPEAELEPEPEPTPDPEEPTPEPDPVVETPDEQTEPKKKERTNWKKRFTTTKKKLDGTIHTLRRELATVSQQNAILMEKVEELTESLGEVGKPEAKVEYTDEEREVLGDEALSTIDRITSKRVKEATKPLEDQLKKEAEAKKEAAKNAAEAANEAALDAFRSLLEDEVPDYDEIDRDPAFTAWLHEDNGRGVERFTLFKNAQLSSDVERVAQFFNDFKSMKDSSNDAIEDQITPEGKGSAPAANTPPATPDGWTMESIDAFYDKVLAGGFKGDDKTRVQTEKAINAFIEKAANDGVPIPAR